MRLAEQYAAIGSEQASLGRWDAAAANWAEAAKYARLHKITDLVAREGEEAGDMSTTDGLGASPDLPLTPSNQQKGEV